YLAVGHQRMIRVEAQSLIQNRMVIKDTRFGPAFNVRLTITARMRQLKTNQQSVSRACGLTMLGQQHLTQARKVSPRVLGNHKLIRICATVMQHGNRFAAPDQLRATSPKIPPAPHRQLGWTTVRGAVPAFHRMNRETVSNRGSVETQRPSER